LKKKILILGVSGLTGYKSQKMHLQNMMFMEHNVRPTKLENCNTFKLDLIQDDQIRKIFAEIKPDIVVNTTALHNVDYCQEKNKQLTNLSCNLKK